MMEEKISALARSADDIRSEAYEQGFSQFAFALKWTFRASPIGWLLVVGVVYGIVPTERIESWVASFAVGWLCAVWVLSAVTRAGPASKKHRWAMAFPVCVSGIGWGSMLYWLFTYDHRVDGWLVLILCGVFSVNLPTYITYPRAYRQLGAVMWFTAAGSVLSHGDGYDVTGKLLTGLFLYILLLTYTIHPIASRVLEGIRLQLTNATLTHQLRQSLGFAKHQASTDALTGQLNRRALNEALDKLVVDGERRRDVFSLLMMDIDFFKSINDRYGHTVGDQALAFVAKKIAGELRGGDLCARYGGEEFVVLLPATSLPQAIDIAERIRTTLAQSTMPTTPPITATLSIGVASYHAGMEAEAIINAADAAVYKAKQNGRNQVVSAASDTVVPELAEPAPT